MDNNYVVPAVGRYYFIRSSENKEAVMCWQEPEYSEEYKRWFESVGCGFASADDGDALIETDDLSMNMYAADFREDQYKESFCEMYYERSEVLFAEILVVLMEYDNKKSRSFSFEIKHADKKKIDEIEEAIYRWHGTGTLSFGDFVSDHCCGAWSEC